MTTVALTSGPSAVTCPLTGGIRIGARPLAGGPPL
jgi:hypothetical protein